MGINLWGLFKDFYLRIKYKKNERYKNKSILEIYKIQKTLFKKIGFEKQINVISWNTEELEEWKNIILETKTVINEIDMYYENDNNNLYLQIYLDKQKIINSLRNKFTRLIDAEDRNDAFQIIGLLVKEIKSNLEEYIKRRNTAKNFVATRASVFNIIRDFVLKYPEYYNDINLKDYNEENTEELLKKLLDIDIERINNLAYFTIALKKGSVITVDTTIEFIKNKFVNCIKELNNIHFETNDT